MKKCTTQNIQNTSSPKAPALENECSVEKVHIIAVLRNYISMKTFNS